MFENGSVVYSSCIPSESQSGESSGSGESTEAQWNTAEGDNDGCASPALQHASPPAVIRLLDVDIPHILPGSAGVHESGLLDVASLSIACCYRSSGHLRDKLKETQTSIFNWGGRDHASLHDLILFYRHKDFQFRIGDESRLGAKILSVIEMLNSKLELTDAMFSFERIILHTRTVRYLPSDKLLELSDFVAAVGINRHTMGELKEYVQQRICIHGLKTTRVLMKFVKLEDAKSLC
ncbi:hypothetical protein M406DRAFT_75461 [Cryphonectria parasitica EP155]|uniref:Uncharacterized protein n=1 Tax=Cryphonectria parasitica (strain ATCC 38755 / EP155) TaxID=660469 RepID=A0A9P5CSG6_CRYP1|nr:uncharacterized protein M406DRAFT_75461 [Cryphonectria parasitica EP155]KAF3768306.1 hypothetical protein M406DRAFT_75461 [Cryphonectria parasitica EP155]